MKNNTLTALAALLLATAAISAESSKLANAMQKASEIMRTDKGTLTQEESAILAAAGISYTKETIQNPILKVATPEIIAKNDTPTKHGIFIAECFLNLFNRIFDK
jgi:enoyl reductase-like protein